MSAGHAEIWLGTGWRVAASGPRGALWRARSGNARNLCSAALLARRWRSCALPLLALEGPFGGREVATHHQEGGHRGEGIPRRASTRRRPGAPVEWAVMAERAGTEPSVFTRILRGEIPGEIVLQTDDVFVLKDIAPKAPVHLLVIPKTDEYRDVTELAAGDPKLLAHMVEVAKTVAAQAGQESFRLDLQHRPRRRPDRLPRPCARAGGRSGRRARRGLDDRRYARRGKGYVTDVDEGTPHGRTPHRELRRPEVPGRGLGDPHHGGRRHRDGAAARPAGPAAQPDREAVPAGRGAGARQRDHARRRAGAGAGRRAAHRGAAADGPQRPGPRSGRRGVERAHPRGRPHVVAGGDAEPGDPHRPRQGHPGEDPRPEVVRRGDRPATRSRSASARPAPARRTSRWRRPCRRCSASRSTASS